MSRGKRRRGMETRGETRPHRYPAGTPVLLESLQCKARVCPVKRSNHARRAFLSFARERGARRIAPAPPRALVWRAGAARPPVLCPMHATRLR